MGRWALLFLIMGCSSDLAVRPTDDRDTPEPDTDTDTDTDADTDTDPVVDVPCSPVQNLEVVPLNIWAEPLDVTLTMNTLAQGYATDDPAPDAVLLPAGDTPFTLLVRAEAPDYHPIDIEISYDGKGDSYGFSIDRLSNEGRAVATEDVREMEEAACPVFTVFLGLEHQWFSAFAPAPSRNIFEMYVGNRDGWAAIYNAVDNAEEQVLWAGWFWDSTFEMVRPTGHAVMSESERAPYTTMGLMEAHPDVNRKILLNRFWGENNDLSELLNTDARLRSYARTSGDRFDVVLQGNPEEIPMFDPYMYDEPNYSFMSRVGDQKRYEDRRAILSDPDDKGSSLEVQAASHHQKFMIVDGETAIITGMNTKTTDWDTEVHDVFEPMRMEFDASLSDRRAVLNKTKLPDFGPRRDYTAQVTGPAVHDITTVFHTRWEQTFVDKLDYSEHNSPFDMPTRAPDVSNGVPLQITLTTAQEDLSILETHRRAVLNAESYIFIEDQYFRAPLMNETIAQRMLEVDDLLLIVVTNEVGEWDGGLKYSYLTDEYFRSQFGDRYLLLQLRTQDIVIEEGWIWDDIFQYDVPIFDHSKIRIIDDRFLSVGTANYNHRSYLYDSEICVSVLDETTAMDARRLVFESLVGDYKSFLSDDPQNNFDVLKAVSDYNGELADWWATYGEDLSAEQAEQTWEDTPFYGYVHPLRFSNNYLEVGPDMF